ncbi:N-acetyllactosaminide beta-1,3-N-acetylglucosaminyltransferase 2 isoform X2 [Anolis carolinensis]|uniref:Hexosyltransferase n=1 Tax=Anolis carolinensis TaxID=28377 RepID=L7MZG1_ANOCA|nr:PREDICTED: N-acetyllactosaminide beta-1,3-N-acetylglucosaminyltransferase 2 [Anolis carolinensis]|eukprot:XP_008121746.1 PREDICTED: N-acetyllactosaminide beta-1,3-N-acetylglucosaminyltransferase 2 [Anolis carolinensis]
MVGRFRCCRSQRIFVICLLGLALAVLLLSPHQSRPSKYAHFNESNFTFLYDRGIHEAFYPHLQHYQCREVVSQKALCQWDLSPKGLPLLLLAITSHPASHSRRSILRRTWARPRDVGGFQLRHVFLLAMDPQPNLALHESDTLGDILMWDFEESHHNLSLKERCFLQWMHRHCQQAAFVFKGDDDLFVNIEALTEYLHQTPNVSKFIHGNVHYRSAVQRWGKYAVSRAFYPMLVYPNFASGGGFIMPQPIIPKLYNASLWVPVFPMEDVYVGFLALAAGLRYRHDKHFRVWGPPRDELDVYQDSVVVHGISMERIEEVWKQIQRVLVRKKLSLATQTTKNIRTA